MRPIEHLKVQSASAGLLMSRWLYTCVGSVAMGALQLDRSEVSWHLVLVTCSHVTLILFWVFNNSQWFLQKQSIIIPKQTLTAVSLRLLLVFCFLSDDSACSMSLLRLFTNWARGANCAESRPNRVSSLKSTSCMKYWSSNKENDDSESLKRKKYH